MAMSIQFGLYLVLMLSIGYYAMRKTKDNEDFIIGGRSLGPVTSAISARASDMSGWLLLGLPGAVFSLYSNNCCQSDNAQTFRRDPQQV